MGIGLPGLFIYRVLYRLGCNVMHDDVLDFASDFYDKYKHVASQ